MQIESMRTIGSHTLFIARIVSDFVRSNDVEMFQAHGFYRAWQESLVHSA
jgi:hypothetical protein